MTQPFMKAYADLLIKTSHRRGAHAMGGMAAQIPIKNDPVSCSPSFACALHVCTQRFTILNLAFFFSKRMKMP